ncbi:galactose oxidase [Microthyrium microscopicum]|uniref:Galactose oxidase n=1 Tax=Microthyrium microscopicum TaxID=703497 RepID=A0A6A6URG1_9PEZI|nr:galactose oxidase [Microthyrium microscopicum]
MKTLMLAIFGITPLVLANINFTWVQPACSQDDAYNKCLKGQHCIGTSCEADFRLAVPIDSAMERRQVSSPAPPAQVTTDGTCGFHKENTVCGSWPDGECCSLHGWCGSSSAHCGFGCQSGPCQSSNSADAVIQSSQQSTFVLSVTSSQAASIVPEQTATANQSPAVTQPATTDGTCGSANGGTVCGNWSPGSCCSSHGWCGNSPAHCGEGCQSDCSAEPISPSPPETPASPSTSVGSEPTLPLPAFNITNDGSCGNKFGDTHCGNWPQGPCCSMFGFCGADNAHCGPGCQSGPCTDAPIVGVPGPHAAPVNPNPGSFQVVGQSGVPAMHAALLPNGKVVFLDKFENYTQLKLPNGQYAYSSEYDPDTNLAQPLALKTNAFCAGGMHLADGRVVSVGGNAPLTFIDPTVGNGFRGIRYLKRLVYNASLDGQGWSEPGNQLSSPRWYPSVQILPDGRQFVASGSLNGLDPSVAANNNPTFEILDQNGISNGISEIMDILVETQPYYMYPFIHLMKDGNLFVFTAKSSQSFNAELGVISKFPDLLGDYRTYPNTGGSVMLPLSSANNYAPDIIVCGGGPYQDITAPTDASCGRIQPLSSTSPTWELDAMPEGRVMVEANLLLDGTVLWLNGANQGGQGFGEATNPTLESLIYDPNQPLGSRWTTGAVSEIPRLYHSVSLMLPDGAILVAGSGPVEMPLLQPTPQNPFITEFRVERYTPSYLSGDKKNLRPKNVQVLTITGTPTITPGGSAFKLILDLPNYTVKTFQVILYHTGFVTHSLHMGHRMVYLDNTGFKLGDRSQLINVAVPPNSSITPPGYYMLFVLADGVPSIGQFVMVTTQAT